MTADTTAAERGDGRAELPEAERAVLAYLDAMEARAAKGEDRSASSCHHLREGLNRVRAEIRDPRRAGREFRAERRATSFFPERIVETPLTIELADFALVPAGGKAGGAASVAPAPARGVPAASFDVMEAARRLKMPDHADLNIVSFPYPGRCTVVLGWEFSRSDEGSRLLSAMVTLARYAQQQIIAAPQPPAAPEAATEDASDPDEPELDGPTPALLRGVDLLRSLAPARDTPARPAPAARTPGGMAAVEAEIEAELAAIERQVRITGELDRNETSAKKASPVATTVEISLSHVTDAVRRIRGHLDAIRALVSPRIDLSELIDDLVEAVEDYAPLHERAATNPRWEVAAAEELPRVEAARATLDTAIAALSAAPGGGPGGAGVLDWHAPTGEDRSGVPVFALGGLIICIAGQWYSLVPPVGETRLRPLQWTPTEVAAVPGMAEARDRARGAAEDGDRSGRGAAGGEGA